MCPDRSSTFSIFFFSGVALLAGCGLFAGCGSDPAPADPGALDAMSTPDASDDTTPVDGRTDATTPTTDATAEVREDVGDEVAADAPADVPTDARADAPAEASTDATADAITDVRNDSLADADTPDARADGDAAAVLTLRPWSGATTSLRLIDGKVLGAAASTKLCVYGDDGDPRPYAVLTAAARQSGAIEVVRAAYAAIPSGIRLRASTHFQLTLTGDPGPVGCDVAQARPLHEGTPLNGTHYTAITVDYDEDFVGPCAARAGERFCGFYPRPNAASSPVPCAKEGLYVLEDGLRLDGKLVAGWRVVNATANASTIEGLAFATHVSTEPSGYLPPPLPVSVVSICSNVPLCDPALTASEASSARSDCTSNTNSRFRIASVDVPRIGERDRATTIYVFGAVGRLLGDKSGLTPSSLGIVVAHDVTDGPLPK